MSAHRNSLDPRYTVHAPTVTQIQPSYDSPKKKLSHAIKVITSAAKCR